jgi:hypothetical protein
LLRQALDAGLMPYRSVLGGKQPKGVVNCRD